jgi:hypothetical protein
MAADLDDDTDCGIGQPCLKMIVNIVGNTGDGHTKPKRRAWATWRRQAGKMKKACTVRTVQALY